MPADRFVPPEEICKHGDRQSCWIVIEDNVYDVTDFLDSHPGGAAAILRYAGRDATEEYNPIHPPGTIEKTLPAEKHLGRTDTSALRSGSGVRIATSRLHADKPMPIETCLSLNDIEAAARRVLSPRALSFFSSAAEDSLSHHYNMNDWDRVSFRPRILRNVKRVNMRRTILGFNSNLPFFIAPAALARLGHPDGELSLVRGCARHNIPYCSSHASSVSHEDLAQCFQQVQPGGCLVFQLYVKRSKAETIQQIHRAKQLGFQALVITVDAPVVGIREGDDRHRMMEALERNEPYVPLWSSYAGGNEDHVFREAHSSTLDWSDLEWIQQEWDNHGPISIKGILTAEDAKMACDMGVQSIYLSNHGGRQLDSAPSPLRALLEIRENYPEVFGKCEVLVDGGIRRSRDALKALCLGATAVGIGRPFLYGVSAYGTNGVSKVVQILSDELETSMRLLGATDVNDLSPNLVNTRDLKASVMSTIPGFRKERAKM